MNLIKRLRNWWQVRTGVEETPLDDSAGWMVSLVVHLGLLVILAVMLHELPLRDKAVELTSAPVQENLEKPEDFAASDFQAEEVGGNSIGGVGVADSLGPVEQDSALVDQGAPRLEAPHALDVPQIEATLGDPSIDDKLAAVSSGTELSQSMVVQGAAGFGTKGAAGAIDRITQEILDSLKDGNHKTLVVWLFDNAMGLRDSRKAILKRMDRIYDELGVVEASRNPAFAKYDDKPLLTSVMVFAYESRVLTARPTDQLAQIKAAIASIESDENHGRDKKFMDRSIPYKMTFSTIYRAAEQFKSYTTGSSRRNIIFVTFTEDFGDDAVEMLDKTVNICRRYGIKNYFVGVPAPFGLKDADVKWVDYDPRFDQTETWAKLAQGPETLLPERVKIAFSGSPEHEEPLDSGFGPFAQTRLAVATGGIYFTVHPNRHTDRPVSRFEISNLTSYLKYFFDQDVMSKYSPDYVSAAEYQVRLRANRAKRALVDAANATWLAPIRNPKLHFPRRDEADLARQLTEAQQQAAKIEPKANMLYTTLMAGKSDREKLTEPRWQAGYDLAMGRVLALKVRTEGYNIMLAKAKRGMKFQTAKDDTWDLRPSREIHAGSSIEKDAKLAEFYLQRVVDNHPGTPWAVEASRELADPMGWDWRESFTNVNPPKARPPANNNPPPKNPPPPRDDQRNVIPPKPTRPPPRL